jgi:hypothetical protein
VPKKTKLQLLTQEVVRAERIPTDRPLTAEEIGWLEDLSARLRAACFGGKQYMPLLKRVSAVRTGNRNPRDSKQRRVPTQPNRTGSPPAAKNNKSEYRRLAAELHRITVAGRPLSAADTRALDALVEELRILAADNNSSRLLWLRAQDVREYLTGKSSAPDRDRSGVPSAGRVRRARGLDLARWEVLGGLPSSRRGH